MKIIVNKFIPFNGFICINLFGLIFTRRSVDKISPLVMNHERIHTKQYLEFTIVSATIFSLFIISGFLSPLFFITVPIMYYVWYVLECFIRFILQLSNLNAIKNCKLKTCFYRAYSNILFEQEAYMFEGDLNYIECRKGFAWLRLIFR